MRHAPLNRDPAEGGFVMIEVLVSALIILIVAGAVLSLMTATTRSAADQRRKAAAYSVAQEDQARLRAMRLTSLNRLEEKREVTLDGGKYEVVSTGRFINNSSGSDSACESTSRSADYVRIASTVSWEDGAKSIHLNSVVAPSNGSLNPNNGALLFTVENGLGQKVAGLGISGTGPGSFSGSTDANGCAAFFDLPVGNYTVQTEATGFVDADGNPSPWTKTVGVETATTSPVQLLYDQPGAIKAEFKYKEGSVYKTATADSIVVYNAGMPSGAKAYATASKARETSVTAAGLFPFKEADTVYPGYCESNLPSETAGRAAVIVTKNATVTTPQIQMPTLNLTVTKDGSAVAGAKVTLTDESCSVSGRKVRRLYTTDSAGHLVNPTTGASETWMPWGNYEICASTGNRYETLRNVSVKSLTSAKSASIGISTGWWGGSPSGECTWSAWP